MLPSDKESDAETWCLENSESCKSQPAATVVTGIYGEASCHPPAASNVRDHLPSPRSTLCMRTSPTLSRSATLFTPEEYTSTTYRDPADCVKSVKFWGIWLTKSYLGGIRYFPPVAILQQLTLETRPGRGCVTPLYQRGVGTNSSTSAIIPFLPLSRLPTLWGLCNSCQQPSHSFWTSPHLHQKLW